MKPIDHEGFDQLIHNTRFDGAASMDKRKEELEKKRQKLADLRKAREERKTVVSVDAPATRDSLTATRVKASVDELVSSLIGDNESAPSKTTPVSAEAPGPSKQITEAPLSEITRKLVSVDYTLLEIVPKERVLYTKETQTPVEETTEKPSKPATQKTVAANRKDDIKKPKTTSTNVTNAALATPKSPAPSPTQKNRHLSEEEKSAILLSDTFTEFFVKSTKTVERVLNEDYDPLTDYTQELNLKKGNADKRVHLLTSFFDERLCKNRGLTDVGWSQIHPELFLSAYSRPQATLEPDGLILVWNLHLKSRPEFVFQTQSEISKAQFCDFQPHLIIGGSHAGQILLWDTRAKATPVLKTPLSSNGHTHPISSMSMVGTQNANNLVTVSTDGTLCSWQLDMLSQPQEIMSLAATSSNKNDDISVTCLGIVPNDNATVYAGTEDGSVWQAFRYDRAGSKAGVNTLDLYHSHAGMVTGIDFHPISAADVADLFLTSSADWTVKLWRAAAPSKVQTNQLPLLSIEEFGDYVYDVKWSPTHPTLFGTVDGSGHFSLYNLVQDMESPAAKMLVGDGKGLNRFSWDRDGCRTALGGTDGRTYIYDIGELAVSKTPTEDASHMKRALNERAVGQ